MGSDLIRAGDVGFDNYACSEGSIQQFPRIEERCGLVVAEHETNLQIELQEFLLPGLYLGNGNLPGHQFHLFTAHRSIFYYGDALFI